MKPSKIILTLCAIVCTVISVSAQIVTPIKWSSSIKAIDDNTAEASFAATIDEGWHLYATDLPDGGPVPTSIVWENISGLEPMGDLTASKEPHREVDMLFHLELGWWQGNVTLTQKFKITDAATAQASGYIHFMACNDESCLPPNKEQFSLSLTPAGSAEPQPMEQIADSQSVSSAMSQSSTWNPVDTGHAEAQSEESPWYIFFGGFIGGLLALLTPCVWPMIPLTVSFFLKKSDTRAKSITHAAGYGLAIIVIYLVLGLAITFLFGASKLNELSTNAVFNLIFFALLVIFAISFFGAFDITLPSSWSSKINNKASSATGWLSIFFMAFTLALVSFSCTGPIIGTLLVEAASLGNMSGPAVGMFGFALALAIPFTLFAIFPSWLKEMPKSGGWLNSVKVILGFIELALSLKFLSVADLAYGWKILDREVFVSLWIAMFMLLSLYLLGKIRFPHDSETNSIGVPRFFLALISLSFAIYLLPGLWGAPLKAISAFAPPLHTQDFNLYEGAKFHEFDNYDEGMAFASQHNLPVFVDFSGHGCVNCRKMEAAVFDNADVRSILEHNFVMVKLMVDDKHALPQPRTVTENGKSITLSTVGDLWSYLQRHKFAANSQPYYVILNPQGNLLAGPYYYNENIASFTEFLESGITNFKK